MLIFGTFLGLFWDFYPKNFVISKEIPIFANGNKDFFNMAKTKLSTKAKEPIKFRFKDLNNGNKSIYLVTYIPGADANHNHTYEHLKLFLVPEVDKASREANRHTMQIANAIKAQRLLEYTNGKAGIKTDISGKLLLVDWMEHYKDTKAKLGQSNSNAVTINNTKMHLIKYKGQSITMKQIDKSFCEGFILYLANAMTIGSENNRKKCEHKPKPLAKSTARLYFNTFVTALNEAVRDGIIQANPTDRLKKEEKKPIKTATNNRPYLDIKEIEALIKTPCLSDVVKQAFLFACFCGLRISDIRTLKWRDIKEISNQVIIEKEQVKTHQQITIPLSKTALQWMPQRGNAKDDDFVFDLPIYFTINYDVKQWAKQAGISKDVTFHIARHTFATTLLTLGADIYTTSKLLGHQNLRTTQIYAEIVNQKKTDAVNLFNGLLD